MYNRFAAKSDGPRSDSTNKREGTKSKNLGFNLVCALRLRLKMIRDKLFVGQWLPVLQSRGDQALNMRPNRWNFAVRRVNPDPK